jgi:hypothetical protein
MYGFLDVNDVLWATGQVVKLKYGCEHTSEALGLTVIRN